MPPADVPHPLGNAGDRTVQPRPSSLPTPDTQASVEMVSLCGLAKRTIVAVDCSCSGDSAMTWIKKPKGPSSSKD